MVWWFLLIRNWCRIGNLLGIGSRQTSTQHEPTLTRLKVRVGRRGVLAAFFAGGRGALELVSSHYIALHHSRRLVKMTKTFQNLFQKSQRCSFELFHFFVARASRGSMLRKVQAL